MNRPLHISDIGAGTTTTVACCVCGESTPDPLDSKTRRWLPSVPVTCPQCKADEAVRREAEDREGVIEDARQAEREERDRLAILRENLPGVLERIGVPFAWRDARFQGCIDLPSKLIDRARTWAAQPAGMVLLCGAAGSGKTFVAVSILAEVLAAGLMYPEKAAFVGERELLDGVKAGFNGDGPGRESELMRRAKAAELVVLDDLASTRLTS